MRILVINGPNLNMLGVREPELYGKTTYKDLVKFLKSKVDKKEAKLTFVQSNYEGKIVEIIQKSPEKFDGIVLNAGAYTHTSLAVLDALKCACLPCAEVHLTDPEKRESYRAFSFVGEYAFETFKGKGIEGYVEAIFALINRVKNA